VNKKGKKKLIKERLLQRGSARQGRYKGEEKKLPAHSIGNQNYIDIDMDVYT
jgi:hypothetical protein